jgi:hypothetical protein
VNQNRRDTLASLRRAGDLVEQRVRPAGNFDGWGGRDVLCHLATYTRLVGAILRATAEDRSATNLELYGRELTEQELAMTDLDEINAAAQRETAALSYAEALVFWRAIHAEALTQLARLTDAQLAAPGPASPPGWTRPHLADVVTALTDHHVSHMAIEANLVPPAGSPSAAD